MKRVPHPSGAEILFDAKWHQYTLDHTALRSVSKLLDGYFPFDEKRILELVSKKTGDPVSVIKANWNRQALLGKNVHEYIECKLLQKPPPTFMLLLENRRRREQAKPADATGPSTAAAPASALESEVLHGEEFLYLPVADKAVEEVLSVYDVLAVEQVIASHEWGLAGTIDFMGRHRHHHNRILIGDWKTSGSVVSSFRFGTYETPSMGCLRHLPNGKFYRYAMQVIVYGEILRQQQYFAKGFFDAALRQSLAGSSHRAVQPGEAAGSGSSGPQRRRGRKPTKSADAPDAAAPTAPGTVSLEAYRTPVFEYGIIQLAKAEDGSVTVEMKAVTEATVLPPDGCDVSFLSLLKAVMEGN